MVLWGCNKICSTNDKERNKLSIKESIKNLLGLKENDYSEKISQILESSSPKEPLKTVKKVTKKAPAKKAPAKKAPAKKAPAKKAPRKK